MDPLFGNYGTGPQFIIYLKVRSFSVSLTLKSSKVRSRDPIEGGSRKTTSSRVMERLRSDLKDDFPFYDTPIVCSWGVNGFL